MIKVGKHYFSQKKKPEYDLIIPTIAKLGTFLNKGQFEWRLVGALGTHLYNGKLIRKHEDLDVEIDIREIEEVNQHFQEYGYILCTGLPTRGRRFLPFEWVCAKDINKIALGDHSLYFVNHKEENTYLRKIDVMLKETKNGYTTIQTLNKKLTFKGDTFAGHANVQGVDIPLRTPEVHKKLLETFHKKNIPKKNNLELQILNEMVISN